jgi:hypothetical protein
MRSDLSRMSDSGKEDAAVILTRDERANDQASDA